MSEKRKGGSSRALPKDWTLSQRLGHYLESSGGHFTARALGNIMRKHPIGVAMTLGRMAKSGANIQKDEDNRWYSAKGEGRRTKASLASTTPVEEAMPIIEAEPVFDTTTSTWKPATKMERAVIQRLADRGRINGEFANKRGIKVTYTKDGNFTIALVKAGGQFYAGVSKRNPTDRDDEEIGAQIAFSRAVRNQPLGV